MEWSWLCCGRSNAGCAAVNLPEPFHLPAPMPEWPQGLGPPPSPSPCASPLSANWLWNQLHCCCALGWVVFRA